MDRIAVFFAAVGPAILILAYGVLKTRIEWGNEALWTAFALGAFSAIATALVELGISSLLQLLLLPPLLLAAASALLVAAIPEETTKFIVLLGVAERHVDARRLQDLIVLALAVSLGFAALENLFFVATPKEWQWTAARRAVAAVPGHGLYGLLMGALVTAARLRPPRRIALIAAALVLPTILHAAYDFPLFAIKGGSAPWLAMISLSILILSAALAIGLCNYVLPKAAKADYALGRDVRPTATAMPLLLGGAAMLIAGFLLGFLFFYLREIQNEWWSVGTSFIPVALAIDLIWTGMRHRKTVPRKS